MEKPGNSQITIYQTEDGGMKLDVRLEPETAWMTQKLMAELCQTTVPNINTHLKNIYEEGELNEITTIKDFLIVLFEKIIKTLPSKINASSPTD